MKEVFITTARKVTPLVIAGLALTGCGSEKSATHPEVVIDRHQIDYDGSEWHFECYGTQEAQITVEAGDTLFEIVANHTHIVTPAAIDQKSLPTEAVVRAVAEANNIADPDMIQVDQTINLLSTCQLTDFE